LLSVVLPAAAAAQAPESPGPYPPAWREVTFVNPYPGSPSIPCRVAYPGKTAGKDAPLDPSGGPYPVIVFGHGYGHQSVHYTQLADHLASWGFLFVAHDTHLRDRPKQIEDMTALVRIARDEHTNPKSILFGAVDVKKIGVAGHSMGGGSVAGILGGTADVQAGLLLAPSDTPQPNASPWMQTARAPYLILAGAGDTTVPPEKNAELFYQMGNANQGFRGYVLLWKGCDHYAVAYTTSRSTPEQIEAFARSRRFSTAFLLALLRDRHPFYDWVVGKGAHADPKVDRLRFEVRSPNLYLTGEPGVGGRIDYHVMARVSSPLVAAGSPLPAAISLPPLGTLGLFPGTIISLSMTTAPADGVAHLGYPVPAAPTLKGLRFWIQAAALDAQSAYRLTPTRDLVLR